MGNNTLEKLKAVREAFDALPVINKFQINERGRRDYVVAQGNDWFCHAHEVKIYKDAVKAIAATLDTLIAEQEKGVCRSDLPDKNSCPSDKAKNEGQPSRQQPASSLVEALQYEASFMDKSGRQAIERAIAIVHQHAREPDVEAGARAIFDASPPYPGCPWNDDWKEPYLRGAKVCYRAAGIAVED